MLNDDTDRIYVYNSKGLIQCLHEIGLEKPISPGEARRQAAQAAAQAAAQKNPEKTGEEPAASKEEKPGAKKEPAQAKPAEDTAPKQSVKPEDKNQAGDEPDKPTPGGAKKADADKNPFGE